MRLTSRSVLWALLIAVMPLPACVGDTRTVVDEHEIVVDNSPKIRPEGGITARLIGFRPLARFSPGGAKNLPDLKISLDLIGDAALAITEVKGALQELGYTNTLPSIEHVKEAMELADYEGKYLFDWQKAVNLSKDALIEEPIIVSNDPSRIKFWNAAVVLNMVATKVIDTQNINHIEFEGKRIAYFKINQIYKAPLVNIYTILPDIWDYKVQSIPLRLAKLRDDVKNYNELEKSLLRNMGEITFGWPIVYTAKEMNLILPHSVTRRYDVYWLEFSTTFRELSASNLTELAINFALPDGSLALELVPIFVGLPISTEKKIRTPDIGVGFRGAMVTVGEVFSRTVSYTYLKPIVEAFGLRQNRFSWTMKDEAVRAGSHKFVAVIGVPKGKDGTEIAMSAHIKSKYKFFFGDVGGTEVHTTWVNF